MRRADRLFQLVQLVRGRRLSTAEFIAGRLEVSMRTVYRDIADLQRQGVPIEGEAGVGYRMRAGFDLPPLMFSRDEAQALVAAVRVAQPRLDAALAQHAEAALSKILSVLPPAARAAAESLAVYAPPVGLDAPTRARLEQLRVAAEGRQSQGIWDSLPVTSRKKIRAARHSGRSCPPASTRNRGQGERSELPYPSRVTVRSSTVRDAGSASAIQSFPRHGRGFWTRIRTW